MGPFQSAKFAIETSTGLSKDALHVLVGMLVALAVVVVLRRRLHHATPFLAALLAALAGEVLDAWELVTYGGGTLSRAYLLGPSLHDIWVTSLMPLLVWMTARLAHQRASSDAARLSLTPAE